MSKPLPSSREKAAVKSVDETEPRKSSRVPETKKSTKTPETKRPSREADSKRESREPEPKKKPKQTTVEVLARYFGCMKVQRTYPLTVTAKSAGLGKKGATLAPIVVVPMIPGAHLSPAQQTLPLDSAESSVTFYVTPLTKGRLPEPTVQLQHLQKTAEPLKLWMKTKSQGFTWLLLAALFVLPALLFISVNHYDWSTASTPVVVSAPRANPTPGNEGVPGKPPVKNPGEQNPKAAPANNNPALGGFGGPRSERPKPPVYRFVEAYLLESDLGDWAANTTQQLYDTMHSLKGERVHLWLAGGLALLVVLSWAMHRPFRRKALLTLKFANADGGAGAAALAQESPAFDAFKPTVTAVSAKKRASLGLGLPVDQATELGTNGEAPFDVVPTDELAEVQPVDVLEPLTSAVKAKVRANLPTKEA